MRVRVTKSNTTTAAAIEANKVRGDRVIATTGGVTSIDTGLGLTGGPITLAGIISANTANINRPGIVQLNDTVTSNSITQAATPNVANLLFSIVTTAYNQANVALQTANTATGNASQKLNIAGGTITGSLNIEGNLIVSGNTTTLNVETLVVEDNQIILNSGQIGPPTLNAEIIINRGDSNNVFLRWDESVNKWGWSSETQNFYPFDIALDAYNQANSAFNIGSAANNTATTANTVAFNSYAQANLAYDQANSATVIANAAYFHSNSTYIVANSAYEQANLAYTQANTSYVVANSAYNQANLAYTQANTATTIAQDAYNSANSATSTAGIAIINANSAYNQANAAYSQANNAYNQANAAYNAANNAAVKVTANSGIAFSANTLSFNNTATVSVVVEQNGSNANVSFIAAPQVIVNDTYTAQGNVTAAATANIANGLYAIATSAYNVANLSYTAANNSNLLSGGLISGTLNVTNDLIVGGNIYLQGNTTYINVSTYQVNDPLIYLAANNDLSDVVDIGFIGGHNTSGVYQHSGLVRHATDGKFYLFTGLADEGHINNVIDIANTTYATLVANVDAKNIILNGNLVATNVQVAAAYNQANLAYDAANNAAVRVTANTGSTISANVISFNNTATIAVTVTGAGSNANVSFATTNAFHRKFVSDGVTNTYSLPVSISNVNNILVSIDGVIILPTEDYTATGTNLTLTFMPPSGLNIEARALR